MKNILIVDDSKTFLLSLTDGFSVYAADFNVFTAGNGKMAVGILNSCKVDLVVTDLRMPEMDGFELLSYMNNKYPTIPIIVTTAFGTSEIEEKIKKLGAVQYLEKPLDFNELADKIFEGLAAGSKGYIRGITLASFLQLLEMEGKTCTLNISSKGQMGHLYFVKGSLIDGETGTFKGEDAVYKIVCWEDSEIEIINACKKRKKNINPSLSHILMEAFRLKDENNRNEKERRIEDEIAGESEEDWSLIKHEIKEITQMEVNVMDVQEKLKEFVAIDGFAGVALFTPTGESLAILESSGMKANLKDIGVLANNVLMNAQKASLDMGTGRGQLVHVEAEKANIIVRCLNEGTDPLKSQPGKAHIHLVLILNSDASIGLAKMKVASIIQAVAEDFRM